MNEGSAAGRTGKAPPCYGLLVLIEPAGDIEHFGNVVAGAAANAVGLLRNAHKDGFDIEELKRFVKLLGFGNGSTKIGFAGHNQRGRFDFGDKIGKRALHVVVGVVPREAGKPIFRDPRNIGSEDKAVPVDDGIKRSGGPETIGVLDGPAGENAATAAAGDVKVAGIDVALGDDGVNAAVEVVEIIAGVGVVNQIGKFLAVAGAAARVGVEDDVAQGGPDLFFKIEAVAIVAERAAVDFEDKGVFFRGIEIGGMDDPALNLAMVF